MDKIRERYMRILLFYDLPMESNFQKQAYRHFRKFLLEEGFIQYQYSVYTKLVLNHSVAKLSINRVKSNLPSDGIVSMLLITEKQFEKMVCVLGTIETNIENSTERIIII